MPRIVANERLAEAIHRIRIEAPRIARRQQAGQFVLLRVHEKGERIPLTIAASDPEGGTFDVIVQGVGKTTRWLNDLPAGSVIAGVTGPLGKPSEMERYGTVVVVGGGVGAAIAYPTAVAFHQHGNRVISILGARSASHLILEQELAATSDTLYVVTDDGSRGEQGLVTAPLLRMLADPSLHGRIDRVLAIGPVPMMSAVAEVTRPYQIPTVVSLNAIMVDGTGMCGGCRVSVHGESRFACVDGPEFDGHQVDFAVLSRRNRTYQEQERHSLAQWEAEPHECRLQVAAAHLDAKEMP